jgi:uncharacterized protein
MKSSRYNIVLHNEPDPGEALIFNTLSGALYQLEPDYRSSLLALEDGSELTAMDQERLKEMATKGYVIDHEADEEAKVIHYLRSAAYSTGSTVTAKIMTTMACNLACRYCFESQMDKAPRLDQTRSQMVVDKLILRAEEIAADKISIDFYGGEPLLNPRAIEHIAGSLMAWAQEGGREFSFSMTSNGTLLTREMVEHLKPLGLANARVTLDGVKDVHDSRRPFRVKGKSSYETIIKNLEEVVDSLPIIITPVCSGESLERFPEFADELIRLGFKDRLAGIQPGLEINYVGKEGGVCQSGGCQMDGTMALRFLEMVKDLLSRGLPFKGELLASNGCAVLSEGSWLITPEGDIHKCPLVSHRPEYAVGSLAEEELWPSNYKFINRELWRKCLDQTDCPYLPMCGIGAGCRIVALDQTGDFWGEACNRDFYQAYLHEAIRLVSAIKASET